METCWGGGIAPRILDLGTRWGQWSASRPSRYTSTERAPDIHWIGGVVCHYAHIDPYPFKTKHNIIQYREKCLKRGDVTACAVYIQH